MSGAEKRRERLRELPVTEGKEVVHQVTSYVPPDIWGWAQRVSGLADPAAFLKPLMMSALERIREEYILEESAEQSPPHPAPAQRAPRVAVDTSLPGEPADGTISPEPPRPFTLRKHPTRCSLCHVELLLGARAFIFYQWWTAAHRWSKQVACPGCVEVRLK